MFIVSLWTSLLGFTEPIFVPEYWNPPSLFDLAQRTGFDIESFIFTFAVGGIVAVIYEVLFKSRHIKMNVAEMHGSRHSIHFFAIISVPLIFGVLWFFTELNPIHSISIALFAGFLATWYCRPELVKKMLMSGVLFSAIYFVAFYFLDLAYPEFVETVWNLPKLLGIFIAGVPLEELIWAFAFGLYWSSVYEHFGWYKIN